MCYDIHVATDEGLGDRYQLQQLLDSLGFTDDNLVHRGIVTDQRTAQQYTNCPLIDIHVSRKVENITELKALEESVHGAMEATQVSGYWHSEYVDFDLSIYASRAVNKPSSFFCDPLELQRDRTKHKKWDIHVCFSAVDLPQSLHTTMIEQGLYYISRRKMRQGKWHEYSIFTLQGVNHPREGRRFCKEMIFWLGKAGAPTFDIKLEFTTRMEKYRNPRAHPPTIDCIKWRTE